jgi:hypothetical protein
MKALFFVVLFPLVLLAAGGDTLQFDATYSAFEDGDTFFVDLNYKPPHDSTRAIINGRLGNVNLATDANIDAAKISASSDLVVDSVTCRELWVSDSAYIDTITTEKLTSTKLAATISALDSISGRELIISDSALIDTLRVNKFYGFDTAFACTLGRIGTPAYLHAGSDTIGTAYFSNIGTLATMAITGVTLTIDSTSGINTIRMNIPARVRPAFAQKVALPFENTGTKPIIKLTGTIDNSGYVDVSVSGGAIFAGASFSYTTYAP